MINKRVAYLFAGLIAGLATTPVLAADPAPAAAGSCDRTCLYGFVDSYLAAMTARDPKKLVTAPDVKFTENDNVLQLGQGLWTTGKSWGTYRIQAADPQQGEVGFVGLLQTTTIPVQVAVRLKIVDHKITEIETIAPGKTIPPVFQQATAKLTEARPVFGQAVDPSEKSSRSELVKAANSYYDGVEAATGDVTAFAPDCHRIEDGIALVNNKGDFHWDVVSSTGKTVPDIAAMGCKEQFNTRFWGTDSISDRRFPIVDEEHGVVFVYTHYHEYSKKQCADMPGYGQVCPRQKTGPVLLDLVEVFKIRGGLIHQMESIWTVMPKSDIASAWK